jgi:uncharacterized protein (DUF2147 family)
MIRNTVIAAWGLCALTAMAQMTPIGLWKTISDNDGSAQAEVRITDKEGVLSGKVERVLRSNFKGDEKCELCKDDRKDQPIVGLEIMRGLKKTEGKNLWEGGTIVDSESGTVYRAKVTPIEGGAKLEMRGFVGVSLFGRTQTWVRIP